MRDCYRVSFDDADGGTIFTRVPFSSLKPDDLFTLEAPPTHGSDVDPIAGEVAVERMYRALSEPYLSDPMDGDWLIDCERI